MDALHLGLDAAHEWLRPIVQQALTFADTPLGAAGEAALASVFGFGAGAGKGPPLQAPPPAPPSTPSSAAGDRAPPRPLTPDQAEVVERGVAANAATLTLPVPGPPPLGPGPKEILRAALANFLRRDDPRGARVAALVAERCIQEAQDLAVVIAEDLERRAASNGAQGKPAAAKAWLDVAAIAYLNHPKIALSRCQKAHELGAEDVETRLWLGTLYYRLGRIGEAEACYRAADTRVWPDDHATRAVALCNIGCVLVTRGDLTGAEAHFNDAMRFAEKGGSKAQQCAVIGNLGLVAFTRSDLGAADELCRRALAIAEELGDKERAALQYGNLGVLAAERGDAQLAREYFGQALDLYDEMGADDHEGARNARAHLEALYG